jgi:hypothetical protein
VYILSAKPLFRPREFPGKPEMIKSSRESPMVKTVWSRVCTLIMRMLLFIFQRFSRSYSVLRTSRVEATSYPCRKFNCPNPRPKRKRSNRHFLSSSSPPHQPQRLSLPPLSLFLPACCCSSPFRTSKGNERISSVGFGNSPSASVPLPS